MENLKTRGSYFVVVHHSKSASVVCIKILLKEVCLERIHSQKKASFHSYSYNRQNQKHVNANSLRKQY